MNLSLGAQPYFMTALLIIFCAFLSCFGTCCLRLCAAWKALCARAAAADAATPAAMAGALATMALVKQMGHTIGNGSRLRAVGLGDPCGPGSAASWRPSAHLQGGGWLETLSRLGRNIICMHVRQLEFIVSLIRSALFTRIARVSLRHSPRRATHLHLCSESSAAHHA